MKEIEVKIKVQDLSEVEEKIKNLGGVLEKPRKHEENTLYDFPPLWLPGYRREHRCLHARSATSCSA